MNIFSIQYRREKECVYVVVEKRVRGTSMYGMGPNGKTIQGVQTLSGLLGWLGGLPRAWPIVAQFLERRMSSSVCFNTL